MSDFIQEFQFYMSYPFVRYALIVGVLIALCSSLLGVTLVLKRFSFIGDGLSHVAFGALAIATVLKIADVNLFIMPVTIICAVLLLKTGNNTQIKGDSAIAMLSVGAMAVGYLILNVFSVSSNVSGDVCSTLFGSTSILTLTGSEVVMCIAASIIVVAFFVIFYNRIFSVTFDEDSGIYLMGIIRSKERGVYRPQQASGAHLCPPLSSFSLQRLLRKQTFQPYKRLPENPWKNRNRMVVGEVENGELRIKSKE